MLESPKLESFAEVGKSQAKMERTERSWKEPNEVSNFSPSFPTSALTFQIQSVLSNRSVLSNFAWLFPTSAKLSNFRLSSLKHSNFSFFTTALSNYTHSTIRLYLSTATYEPFKSIQNNEEIWEQRYKCLLGLNGNIESKKMKTPFSSITDQNITLSLIESEIRTLYPGFTCNKKMQINN